jgi:hypothetical protein
MDDNSLTTTADGRPARISAGRLVLDPPKIVALLAFAAIGFLFLMGMVFKKVNP